MPIYTEEFRVFGFLKNCVRYIYVHDITCMQSQVMDGFLKCFFLLERYLYYGIKVWTLENFEKKKIRSLISEHKKKYI